MFNFLVVLLSMAAYIAVMMSGMFVIQYCGYRKWLSDRHDPRNHPFCSESGDCSALMVVWPIGIPILVLIYGFSIAKKIGFPLLDSMLDANKDN